MLRTCAYCEKQFEAKRKRLCCDRSCSAKLTKRNRGENPWSEQELDFLREMMGSVPHYEIIRSFKGWAKKKGYIQRTDTAIEVKLKRLYREGYQRKCTLDNWTMRELARSLDISVDRVRGWIRDGLPCRKVARNQLAIRHADIKKYFLEKPHWATGIDRDRLIWLLDSRKDADRVLVQSQDYLHGVKRPVINLDTGVTYPSLRDAANKLFVSPSSIGGAIRRDGKCLGCKWAFVDKVRSVA